MVPLLSSVPDPQNVLVMRSSGCTVLVSRSQSAPQAEWLLICKGSSVALSNHTTTVGETTIASSARMPEVAFWSSKDHDASAAAVASPAPRTRDEKKAVHILSLSGTGAVVRKTSQMKLIYEESLRDMCRK